MRVRAAATIAAFLTTMSLAAISSPAKAQVVYGAAPHAYGYVSPARNGLNFPLGDSSPYDVAFGTRPSFEIIPTPNPYAPAVRVVERCNYPNGWNVTDFDRDLNGTPAGIDHTCPVPPPLYGHVRARY